MKLSSSACTVYSQQSSVHNTLVIVGSSPESNSILWISALLILANCYVSHPLLIDPSRRIHCFTPWLAIVPIFLLKFWRQSVTRHRSVKFGRTRRQWLIHSVFPTMRLRFIKYSKMIQSKSIISLWSHKISIKNAFASSRGNFLLWLNIIWKVSDN
jgi:hypothetical protein